MMETFPADAVSKRVMHPRIMTPPYDWPETNFTFRQATIYDGPITPCGSPGVAKFSPLVSVSGETTRWQKIEVNKSINQVLTLCHVQSAADVRARWNVSISI